MPNITANHAIAYTNFNTVEHTCVTISWGVDLQGLSTLTLLGLINITNNQKRKNPTVSVRRTWRK